MLRKANAASPCTAVPKTTKGIRINEALLTGQSLRNVAQRFGTSVTPLHRHRKEIPKKIREGMFNRSAGNHVLGILC